MENENPTPGVPTSPVDPGAEQAPATPPSNGSEPVINSDGAGDQTVPFSRFQEVNDRAREYESEKTRLEQELEELRSAQQPPAQEEDDLDPEVEALISKVLSKQGYVKKDDLAAQQVQIQYGLDTRDLTEKYKDSGIPFDASEVRSFANKEGIQVTNKASLEAVYKVMNQDKLLEIATNKALTQFQENGGKTSAEKPGPGGAKVSEEPEVHGLKGRIAAARQKVS